MDLDEQNKRYAGLIIALRRPETPGDEVNRCLARILEEEGRDATPRDWAGDLLDAMSLLPHGSWFRWNHFGFHYVPTEASTKGPWSNGTDYLPDDGFLGHGGPVGYEAMGHDSDESRRMLPRLVLQAVMMARRAGLLKSLARRDGRPYLVQTGNGPLLAMPEGGSPASPPAPTSRPTVGLSRTTRMSMTDGSRHRTPERGYQPGA